MAANVFKIVLVVLGAFLSWLLPSGGGCKPGDPTVPDASDRAGGHQFQLDLSGAPDLGSRWRLACERYQIDVSKQWGSPVRKDTGQPVVTIESIRCGGSAVPNPTALAAFEHTLNNVMDDRWVKRFKKNCSWEEPLTPPIGGPSAKLDESDESSDSSDSSDGENTSTEPGQRPLGALHIAVVDHLAWGEFLTVLMRVDITCRGIFSANDGESHYFSLNYNLDEGINGKEIDKLIDPLLPRLREACENVTASKSIDCHFFFGKSGVAILPQKGEPNPDVLTDTNLIRYDALRSWLETSPMRKFLELRSIP